MRANTEEVEEIYKHEQSVVPETAAESLAARTDSPSNELLRDSQALHGERVRTSAPPQADELFARPRPQLTTRSASYLGPASSTPSPLSTILNVERPRKRRRSVSGDLSDPSMAIRTNDSSKKVNRGNTEDRENAGKADEALEEGEVVVVDPIKKSKGKPTIGLKHITLLYRLTDEGFKCQLCL